MAQNKIQAIGFTEINGQFKKLQITEQTLGDHDILVKVEGVAMNPIDYKKKEGAFISEISEEKPQVIGYDASGVVLKTGSKVTAFKEGDEVMYAGEVTKNGSNAEKQVVDSRIVGKKPKDLSWAQAAAIPLVGITAYEAMVENLDISINKEKNKNKSILVVGGAGGVGSIALQIAKKILGLNVIATASRPETVEYSKKCGADIVINHRNPLKQELEKQDIKQVDYIFCTVDITSDYFDQFTDIIGFNGGIVGITGFQEKLNMMPLFAKKVKVSIELMFSKAMFQQNLVSQQQILNRLAEAYDSKEMFSNAEVIKEFNIENLDFGHEACKKGANIGKIAYKDVQKFFQ